LGIQYCRQAEYNVTQNNHLETREKKKQENHISHARIIKPGMSREKTNGEKSQKLTYRSTPTQWSTPHHPLTTSHRDVLSYAWAYHAYPSKGPWLLTKLAIQSRNVPHNA
jgi:hypothetical protein